MSENRKPAWKGIGILCVFGTMGLIAQSRLQLPYSIRSMLLIFGVLVFYGLLGLLANMRVVDEEEHERKSRKSAANYWIESPVKKVNGQVVPRSVAEPAADETIRRPVRTESN